MKKLLIIQKDQPYFLHETLQVLHKHREDLKSFELHLLVNNESLEFLKNKELPLFAGIIADEETVLSTQYDLSFNLSLEESSWHLHAKVKASMKFGPLWEDGRLKVPDDWSAYLMTLKSRAPFLTFHLQDIFRNILGIRKPCRSERGNKKFQVLAYGMAARELMSADEQEELIHTIHLHNPGIFIKEVSEIDLVEDLSHVLYVGPATLDAIRVCEAGATGLFISRHFEGFNILPYGEGNIFVSSRGKPFQHTELEKIVRSVIKSESFPLQSSLYSLYRSQMDETFGSYLVSLNPADDHYPVYQSHLVLWNFILSMLEVNLPVSACTYNQATLIKGTQEVLGKLIRFHDYAMVSLDIILRESQKNSSDQGKIEGHLHNIREIDATMDKISVSHSMLRPLLDFYRIRKGQNEGSSLNEQVKHSLLVYSEEHHVLEALDELFSVTLQKNEVTI